jgi:hypothetical protein
MVRQNGDRGAETEQVALSAETRHLADRDVAHQ